MVERLRNDIGRYVTRLLNTIIKESRYVRDPIKERMGCRGVGVRVVIHRELETTV